jgi:hypothetical protein
MEFLIQNAQPFEEVEAQAIGALQRAGFVVQRTFSLRSAMVTNRGTAEASPGYSVLLLHASGEPQQVLGLVTLYERAGQTVIQPRLMAARSRDAEAEILVALGQGGLDLCMDASGNSVELLLDQESTE